MGKTRQYQEPDFWRVPPGKSTLGRGGVFIDGVEYPYDYHLPNETGPSGYLDVKKLKFLTYQPTAYQPEPGRLLPTATGWGPRFIPDAATALDELIQAAEKDGVYLGVTKHYFDYNEQLGSAKPNAAPAGDSNHGWGRAADFRTYVVDADGKTRLVDIEKNPAAFNWLVKNGWKYGWAKPNWSYTQPGEAQHFEYVYKKGGQNPMLPIKGKDAGESWYQYYKAQELAAKNERELQRRRWNEKWNEGKSSIPKAEIQPIPFPDLRPVPELPIRPLAPYDRQPMMANPLPVPQPVVVPGYDDMNPVLKLKRTL